MSTRPYPTAIDDVRMPDFLRPLEDGPCAHCGAIDRGGAAYHCPNYRAPERACHGEKPK